MQSYRRSLLFINELSVRGKMRKSTFLKLSLLTVALFKIVCFYLSVLIRFANFSNTKVGTSFFMSSVIQ